MKENDRYGMLTLIKRVPKPEGKNFRGSWWLCQCDCGQQTIVNYHELYSGDTKSCGCLKKRQPIYDKKGLEISNHAGIYGFQNIYNGKWYVGKAKNLYNRYKDHYNDWKNHQEKQFYQAIKKYGWENFNYYILKEYNEIPSKEELSIMEEFFIKEKDSYQNGYNASQNSSGGFVSKEHEEKCKRILDKLNLNQKNENHPRTSFTKEEILQIFDYAMQGAPVRWVYKQYSSHDITYESFKHLYRGEHFKDYLPKDWDKRPIVSTNSTLWGIWVIDIKTRFQRGEKIEDVYKIYKDKCSFNQLKDIKNNKTYKHIHPCID
jgi:group I intron endonuclease